MKSLSLKNLRYEYIQAIRFSHALMESKYRVTIPPEHVEKYRILKDMFHADFEVGENATHEIDEYQLIHKDPTTGIGSIMKPIVFPHTIVEHCKTLWPADRPIDISFAGLVTGKRGILIGDWCKNNLRADYSGLPNLNPLSHSLINKIRKAFGLSPNSYTLRINELVLWSSIRGRTFPIKSWDQEYFDLLTRSNFVLCPSGYHVWSYRFFESILCGAIPIVEKDCPAYKGFHFYYMDDPISEYKWDQETALKNYQLCADRITIPIDELNRELERLTA
jgi:hypothetical protein